MFLFLPLRSPEPSSAHRELTLELTDGLPRGSDVDYAEFEANRMTAEDRAFFDENGYVRLPLFTLPLRFAGAAWCLAVQPRRAHLPAPGCR